MLDIAIGIAALLAAAVLYVEWREKRSLACPPGRGRSRHSHGRRRQDDRLYDGPRPLAGGLHTYRASGSDEDRIALLWAPAAERAFAPFNVEGNWR